MELSVVIPSLKEADNLSKLLPQLRTVLSDIADKHEVIVVEEGQVLPGGSARSGVARGGCALVSLLEVRNSTGIGCYRRGGVVGRAIIDDDDLDVRIGLGQRALEGHRQELRPVVGWNDDGDARQMVASGPFVGPHDLLQGFLYVAFVARGKLAITPTMLAWQGEGRV